MFLPLNQGKSWGLKTGCTLHNKSRAMPTEQCSAIPGSLVPITKIYDKATKLNTHTCTHTHTDKCKPEKLGLGKYYQYQYLW